MKKELNTIKIDAKITPTLHGKVIARAETERRNKSEMVRVILEESFIAGKMLDEAVKVKGEGK